MAIKTTDIEIINAMRLGVDYSFKVAIRSFSLRLRPLSISENIQVIQNAADRMSSIPEALKNRLTENALIAKETIKIASTSDVGATDSQITDLVMDRMTPDELQTLFKQYVAQCDRVNPSLEKMTRADIDALIETVKKNANDREGLALQLIGLSHLQLHNLALCLLDPNGD